MNDAADPDEPERVRRMRATAEHLRLVREREIESVRYTETLLRESQALIDAARARSAASSLLLPHPTDNEPTR